MAAPAVDPLSVDEVTGHSYSSLKWTFLVAFWLEVVRPKEGSCFSVWSIWLGTGVVGLVSPSHPDLAPVFGCPEMETLVVKSIKTWL